jgi:NAD(P)-dependent dehydrogenase (short-subunit alcohol dehydrogenase family)
MLNLFDLTGEVAAVIGGTGVLGGAMAEALAGAGAKIAILGRSAERGAEAVSRIEKLGGAAIFQSVDAMSKDSLAAARDAVIRKFGSVTVLVNGAGGNKPEGTVMPGGDFTKMSFEGWKDVFDLNLVGGALFPCQVFGETMLAQKKGSIINIASISSILPLSRVVSYSASKAAVLNFTQWLAREWATKGVRVNAITPGFFPAEQNRRMLLKDDGTYTERGQAIVGHTPMGRFGEAHELAGATVWLASPKAASFVTGQNIVVDGGFSSVTI